MIIEYSDLSIPQKNHWSAQVRQSQSLRLVEIEACFYALLWLKLNVSFPPSISVYTSLEHNVLYMQWRESWTPRLRIWNWINHKKEGKTLLVGDIGCHICRVKSDQGKSVSSMEKINLCWPWRFNVSYLDGKHWLEIFTAERILLCCGH